MSHVVLIWNDLRRASMIRINRACWHVALQLPLSLHDLQSILAIDSDLEENNPHFIINHNIRAVDDVLKRRMHSCVGIYLNIRNHNTLELLKA